MVNLHEILPHNQNILQEFKEYCKDKDIRINSIDDMGSFYAFSIVANVETMYEFDEKLKEFKQKARWWDKLLMFLM